MKYVFHPKALNKYAEAVEYYASQWAEIAQAFVGAIEDVVYRIRSFPTSYAVIDEDVRWCMAHRFPYGVLYTIEPDYVLILSVMHCSREPGHWKNRK